MQTQIAYVTRSFLMMLLATLVAGACSKPDTTERQAGTGDSSGTSKTAAAGTKDSLAIPLKTPDGTPARFAFKSGEILMHYKGDFQGVRRLVFDDYGLRESKYDSAVPSQKVMAAVPPYQLSIITPEYYGGIDLRSGKGQKARNAAYQRYLDSPELMKTPFGEMALERSGAQRLPDTVLMGKYPCRVYRRSYPHYTQTMWVWGGVPIREKMELTGGQSGNYMVEPVSIQTGVEVPDSLFTFPSRYTVTEVAPPSGE